MVPVPTFDTRAKCRSFRRTQLPLRLTVLWLLGGVAAAELPGDWTGNYPRCDRHGELTNNEHMKLGVRFYTSAPEVRAAFVRAMDFWATVLDMEWYEENSTHCAIQIVDGGDNLFKSAQVARSQFPWRPRFQGWIAFNPKPVLTPSERYTIAVHEVGHMLGLPHNPSARSVMYYLSLDGVLLLDSADLAALSARHKLRVAPDKPHIVAAP
jgi:hypothetical protein